MSGATKPLQMIAKRPATVRVKDIPFPPDYCSHVASMLLPVGVRAALWEKYRGRLIHIDLGSFRSGACALCDHWIVAEPSAGELRAFWQDTTGQTMDDTFVARRVELEIGD